MDITNPATDSQRNQQSDNIRINGIAFMLWLVMILIGIGGIFLLANYDVTTAWIIVWVAAFTLLGFYLLFAIKIAKQWEKVVVLHLGKFKGLRGPGLFWITPGVDTTAAGSTTG